MWLYYRCALSHRDVEELLAERGVRVSYEVIRLWCRKFGPTFAAELRRRRARARDRWRLDEVQLKIEGKRHWLWPAVYPLSALGALVTDLGVTDLAARHDWYARGRRGDEHGADGDGGAPDETPKR